MSATFQHCSLHSVSGCLEASSSLHEKHPSFVSRQVAALHFILQDVCSSIGKPCRPSQQHKLMQVAPSAAAAVQHSSAVVQLGRPAGNEVQLVGRLRRQKAALGRR
jgi:hypothetical protein